MFFKYILTKYKYVNEFLFALIVGHLTYCVMHRIKNDDKVFGRLKVNESDKLSNIFADVGYHTKNFILEVMYFFSINVR